MTCNCVLVGYCPTRMTEEFMPKEIIERYATEIPLGRPSDPEEDIGNVVAWLASEKGCYVTGAKFPVTGGLYECIAQYG